MKVCNTVIVVCRLVTVIRIVRDAYLNRVLESYYQPSDAYRILHDSLLVILGLHTSLHNNIPTRFRSGYILYIDVRC